MMTQGEYFEYEHLKEKVRSLSFDMAHATGYNRVLTWDKLITATANILEFERRVLGLESGINDTTSIHRWALVSEGHHANPNRHL